MEKAKGRALKNGVDGGLNVQLCVLDNIWANVQDWGSDIAINITRTIKIPRLPDLVVPKISQLSRRP